MKDQFFKLFDADGLKATTETVKPSQTKAEKTAGAGQFSLFDAGGAAPDASAEFSSRKTIANTAHHYQTVQAGMGFKLFLQNLNNQTSVCFDTDTTSLNPLEAQLVGIVFSWEKANGFYLPFPEEKEEAQKLIDELLPFFENESIQKIGQNLKYDIKVLHKYGVSVKGKLFDTMIAHYLINPDMRHNMDVLAETYLNYTPVSITELSLIHI